jgi:DNA modification methylase
LIDGKGNVIAGHGRVLAAPLAGITEVPTVSLEHLTAAQARAFMLADNRLAQLATWNDRLLAENLKALSEVEINFSLEATGFQMGEIDVLIEGLAPATKGEADPADLLPRQAKRQVSRAGDIWTLGRHRVYCGDARERSAYRAVMDNKRAAMVLTDPPFNVPIDGYASGFGAVHHKEFQMACGEMNEAEFERFLTQVMDLLAAHSVDGALHLLFMDQHHVYEITSAAKQVYAELKGVCVWDKAVGGQGSLYRSQHELVFVYKKGRSSHTNNVQLGKHGRYRSNVWKYPRPSSFGRASEEGYLAELHPTVKPVALMADAILDCSKRGDIVLDAFLGSGTTLIAAERTGRICYGLEIDPVYIDTTIRRWQTFAGQQAIHANSRRTFREVEEELHEHKR